MRESGRDRNIGRALALDAKLVARGDSYAPMANRQI
jgi:hypothetical protein